ncbi:beta-ketoacyl-ACP synthase III [Actinomycetospora sp. NBC_00405]|uniref:beta-ketoacyl-ACP synthase III n=1 Tax=Actinomycetospora sp. NBC_00405 TaxID=2975952 RepID=UPI002E25118B
MPPAPIAARPAPVTTGERLLGLGAYRPRRTVDNDEVCAPLEDVDPDWVVARSGIRTRRFAGVDETVVAMSTAAAGDALTAAGLTASALDAVLVATMSPDTASPQVSTRVAAELGTTAPAFDLGAACSGFCYGLEVAASLIRGGTARHVLVIGVERMSDLLDPRDRGTAFLFGDGAGAVVVGPADEPGIGPVAWGSDGGQADLIVHSPTWQEAAGGAGDGVPGLRMQGPAVFRWASTQIAPLAEKALAAAGVGVDDLDAFVPHQANNRITDGIVRALALPDGVAVARDVVDTGNTSAASVPLAMHALLTGGEVRAGDLALVCGFGAGLTYAAQVLTLPPVAPSSAPRED